MKNKITLITSLLFTSSVLSACSYAQNLATKLSPSERENAAIEYYAAPNFPEAAAKSCQAGTVLVQYDVGFSGEVKPESVRVLADAGSPVLADAAVDAVRQWRYAPAMAGDAIVERTGLQTEVNFEIEGCDPAKFADAN